MLFAADTPPSLLPLTSRLTAIPTGFPAPVGRPSDDDINFELTVAVVQIGYPQLTPFFMSATEPEPLDLGKIRNEIIENTVPSGSDVVSRTSPIQVTVIDSGPAAGCDHAIM